MIKSFTVDRARWGKNALKRRDNGKMCCLGFLSLACGVPEAKLCLEDGQERGFPDTGWPGYPDFTLPDDDGEHIGSSSLEDRAASINDGDLDDADKEAKLIELFAKHNIELTFTGTKEPS